MRRHLVLFSAIAGTLVGQNSSALDVGLSVSEESEYTTNSGRTERDEVEEWIHSPGVGLVATHEGPSATLDVNYDFNRNIYQQDLYDDENEAAGSANLVWNALPERLDFTIAHTRTQSAIRSIGPTTPDNRQETSNTNAGPTLRFNPRGEDEIQLQYLWGDRSSEETDNDAITHDTSLRYILAMSQTSSLTFSAVYNQVQYENPFAPDIEYNIGQVTLDRESSNLVYSLTGGYNKTKRTKGRDDVDGFIFDADVQWQVRPSTDITLTAARDIRDQSENLSTGTFEEDLDFSVDSDLSEVFTNERLGISIAQRLGATTSLDLSANIDDEDYEDVGRDTERQSIRLGLTRQLTPRLGFNLGLSFETEDLSDEGDEADTLRGDLSLDYAIGRSLNAEFGLRYEERESDTGIAGRDYDEWAAILRISYDVIPLDR